jgi:hypothetical protein
MHAHNGRIDLQDALSATVGADMVVSEISCFANERSD